MTNDFATLIPKAKLAGLVATATAAAITAQFGWHLGKGIAEQVSLAILLGLCTFIVGYALVFAWQAYKANMRAVGHASIALFAIAVVVEFMSHTGFTAANRDASIASSKLQQTNTEFAIGNVDQISKQVQRLEERLRMVPLRNAEQAQAAIDNAMAHRFWQVTEGCRRTTGPQTRQFCSDYASAVADKAGSTDTITMREELKIARADHAKALAQLSSKTASTSYANSQGAVIASMVTASEQPDATAVYWAGIGLSSILALFAISAGGLLNFITFAFEAGARQQPTTGFVRGRAPSPETAAAQNTTTIQRLDGCVISRGVNGEPILTKVQAVA